MELAAPSKRAGDGGGKVARPYTFVYGRALSAGLASSDLARMGFNKVMNILASQEPAPAEEPDGPRDATQADIDAFRRS